MPPHQNMAAVPSAPLSVQQTYGNATRYNDKLLAYIWRSVSKRFAIKAIGSKGCTA